MKTGIIACAIANAIFMTSSCAHVAGSPVDPAIASEAVLREIESCIATRCPSAEISTYFLDRHVMACLIKTINSRHVARTEIFNSITLGKNVPVIYYSPADDCPPLEIGVSIVMKGREIQRMYVNPVLD